VIATYDNPAKLPYQIYNFIGIRAVANDIAEIPNSIVRGRSSKNRLEGREVGVDVGDDKCAHFNPSVAS
jgi:hypothetical protein